MNIKRMINKNYKLIWYIILIIVFILFIIKSFNTYYENDEQRKKAELIENQKNEDETEFIEKVYNITSNSIEETMDSFVNYCNTRELENAYKMLTQECKDAMFPTLEHFEKIYVNKIYNIKRKYELERWTTEGNKSIYLVSLYGDILATGGVENLVKEYYTFVELDNGIYRLNINNYIYGEYRNLKNTDQGLTIKIGQVDVFNEYESVELTITNDTSKRVYLTGNKYSEKIYLQDSKGLIYESLNSEFDQQQIILNPGSYRTFVVKFNKIYDVSDKKMFLTLSDVILDYDEYIQLEDKQNYYKRTEVKVDYKNNK